jgi:DNA repair protein RadC
MAITDWPSDERPREKLIRLGPSSLSDAELLAVFLRTGVKGKTAVDLARDLLHEFTNLSHLLGASLSQLASINGLGKAKFSMLQAALELGKRYLEENLQLGGPITSIDRARKYLIAKLSGYKYEVFACIFLTTRHHIIQYKELFYGTLDCTPVYPRVVAQKALECNAGAVIFAHNHPSGNTEPSPSDIASTKNLISVLDCLDIRVLDHIIIGGHEGRSLAEEGFI